jgi:hypothetical protein
MHITYKTMCLVSSNVIPYIHVKTWSWSELTPNMYALLNVYAHDYSIFYIQYSYIIYCVLTLFSYVSKIYKYPGNSMAVCEIDQRQYTGTLTYKTFTHKTGYNNKIDCKANRYEYTCSVNCLGLHLYTAMV